MKALITSALAEINKTTNNNFIISEITDSGNDDGNVKVSIKLISNEGNLFSREVIEKDDEKKENQIGDIAEEIYKEMLRSVFLAGMLNMSFKTNSLDNEIMRRHTTKNRNF